jgi:cell division protein ZapD
MTDLIYEQPLSEKIRSYLRLEHLANQLQDNLLIDHQQRCFYPLFSLCELTERCDYRSEVLKDIDRHLNLLCTDQAWPSIDPDSLPELVQYLQHAREVLQRSERIGVQLKQDRFLCALRQRFAMPGACCNFDLPQLHFWLAKSWSERQQAYRDWISHFDALLSPIKVMLQLTRSTAEFTPALANGGFFQGDSNQPLSLIRVRVGADNPCYPTISGHKNRYAIHFVHFEQQRHSDQPIEFMLATCP